MTVGEVTRERGRWRIRCAPHVRLRLRRVFEGISKAEHDVLTISDTLEHCRELAWFLERFPMDLPAALRARLAARAAEHAAQEAAVETMLAPSYRPCSFALALPARSYQALAAELWLRVRSLLVADDVGLGKTALAICALTDPQTRPALVVTLTHLPPQWVDELAKFAPALRVHVLTRGKPYKLPEPFPDVVVSNYHKLAGWADELAPRIQSVVFDEAQELRRSGTGNAFTDKYAAAKHLADHADFRLGLTATPIYNYGAEMWNVLRCLAPHALGTRQEFEREWCSGDSERITDPKAFGKYLRGAGLMLRRTRRDVARELPDVTRIPHYVDADLHALDAVETSATELARIILAETELRRGSKLQASQELSYKLRQATGIAKARHVAAFARMLLDAGERVLLYGWHHACYDLWRESFRDVAPAFYTGEESVAEKLEAKRRFVTGETPLLIMSLRAGAGIDGLQHVCRTVVFGELDWSPAVHEQALGRVHRDGQADKVMAYFLLAEVGSDPVIADVLGLKRRQAEGIRDPDAELLEDLQVDEHHIRRLAERYLSAQPARRHVA